MPPQTEQRVCLRTFLFEFFSLTHTHTNPSLSQTAHGAGSGSSDLFCCNENRSRVISLINFLYWFLNYNFSNSSFTFTVLALYFSSGHSVCPKDHLLPILTERAGSPSAFPKNSSLKRAPKCTLFIFHNSRILPSPKMSKPTAGSRYLKSKRKDFCIPLPFAIVAIDFHLHYSIADNLRFFYFFLTLTYSTKLSDSFSE